MEGWRGQARKSELRSRSSDNIGGAISADVPSFALRATAGRQCGTRHCKAARPGNVPRTVGFPHKTERIWGARTSRSRWGASRDPHLRRLLPMDLSSDWPRARRGWSGMCLAGRQTRRARRTRSPKLPLTQMKNFGRGGHGGHGERTLRSQRSPVQISLPYLTFIPSLLLAIKPKAFVIFGDLLRPVSPLCHPPLKMILPSTPLRTLPCNPSGSLRFARILQRMAPVS